MNCGALLAALPALPEDLREDVPVALDQFWWRATMEGDPALKELIQAVLLMRGVVNIIMALEGKEPSYFASLTRANVREPEFYPEFAQTVSTENVSPAEVAEQLWKCYFEYALDVAADHGSDLLTKALRWEIGFRNGLATRRAVTLSLGPNTGKLLEDYGTPVEEFEPELSGIDLTEDDPVEVERCLGRIRLDRLDAMEPWVSTDRDAIIHYALRLLVLKHSSVLVAKEQAE